MRGAGGWLLVALAGAVACGGGGRDRPAPPDSTLFGDDREHQGNVGPTAPEVALIELVSDSWLFANATSTEAATDESLVVTSSQSVVFPLGADPPVTAFLAL